MIPRAARKLLSADAIGLMLVLIALQTLTYGIASSLRATDTNHFFAVCLIAALIGLGLGKTRMNGIQASAGLVALGFLGIWILGAGLVSPLVDLVASILSLFPQFIPVIRFQTDLDTSRIATAWGVIAQASSALALRFQRWVPGPDGNVIVNDALMRNLSWIMILWLVTAWLGWFAGRRNAILALMPCVILLAGVTSYSETGIEFFWLMVFILLLLMGIWNYRNHIQQWETGRVDYSDSIRYDLSQAVLFLSITISTLAFITPSLSWRQVRDYFRERDPSSSNETADLLGVQEEPIPVMPVGTPEAVLPREHLLRGGTANSPKIVMTIRTGELPPSTNPVRTVEAPRHYWRSVTYDVYTGAGWFTSPAPSQSIPANTPLIPGLLSGYKLLHLDVQMQAPEGKLFWSGMLFSADIPIEADWRVRPVSNLFADQPALLQSDIFAAFTEADSYRAESYIPNVSVAELRSASTAYPEDIVERYLPLPRSLPERVGQLADEITAGMDAPYDKAKAIERYLRAKYPYDLKVPAPPEGQDVADYFLFDLKKGYCDYYATAMVVLARASGVPARFVSGYAPGSYDALTAQYVIRELHAHSWAEVYFPGIGWIEFEPTASQPEVEHTEASALSNVDQTSDSTASDLLRRYRLERLSLWGLPFAALAVLLMLYFTVVEGWLLMRLPPATAIERMYRGFYRLGRPLAGERPDAETAHEFMSKVIRRLEAMQDQPRFAKICRHAQNDVMQLTDLYQSSLFSRQQTQREDAGIALKTWKQLRRRLILSRIILSLRAARRSSVRSTYRDPAA